MSRAEERKKFAWHMRLGRQKKGISSMSEIRTPTVSVSTAQIYHLYYAMQEKKLSLRVRIATPVWRKNNHVMWT